MTTPKPELKPCPFCGKQPKLFKVSLHGWHVACAKENVICVSLKYKATKELAITAWNTRHERTALLEEVLREAWRLPKMSTPTKECDVITLEQLKQIIKKLN